MGMRARLIGSLIALVVSCVTFSPVFGQDSNSTRPAQAGGKAPEAVVGRFQDVHPIPEGGPAPRPKDGHPDLTGRWYPNKGGRMLQVAYPLDDRAFRQFDGKATPEEKPQLKPGLPAKYTKPAPYGECDQPGTPSAALEQISQHAPMELISQPGKVWMMFEYPMDVRLIHADGSQHPKDPDPSFNGDSHGHWEGDTLVIDVTAIDERLKMTGAGGNWYPSDKMHVVERITRTSKNYLTYQLTIDDPVVLAKPWKSAPRTWSLAQDPDDLWTEVFCTLNEEPAEIQRQNASKAQAGK